MTSKHPKWLDNKVPESFFDEDLYRIILFFVFYSPCRNYCTQGRTLQYYGWQERPWGSPKYLKDKLDKGSSINKKEYFKLAGNMADLVSILKLSEFNKDFYKNKEIERAAFLKKESNEYMSLFYHIRCSLAHGRMTMFPIQDDVLFIMENGYDYKNKFKVTARMVLRKSTLLNWVDIITAGPKDNDQ